MRLINANGEEITVGTRLRVVSGPRVGEVWNYSHLTVHPVDGHRVHVTRRHPRMGHVHREFHPGVFGLSVEIDITWRRAVRNRVHLVRRKFDDYLFAGIIALFPLAFFEQFHLGEKITEAVALIMH